MFQSIYDWMTGQGSDINHTDRPRRPRATTPPPTASQIGAGSDICNPDHPNPGLRHDHRNHVHVQVGPTEWEDPQPVDPATWTGPGTYWGRRPPPEVLRTRHSWQQWDHDHPPGAHPAGTPPAGGH
jgi:hypothetical protein